MTLRLTILALLLAGCASGLQQYAGDPPPANYRTIIAGKFLTAYPGKYDPATALISQPDPGARDVVSGWRVCIRVTPKKAGSEQRQIAYFFVDRRIENVTVGDDRCNIVQYEPWTELNHADSWTR